MTEPFIEDGEEEVQAVPIEPAKAVLNPKGGASMYIGPTIIGVIQKGTVYGECAEAARVRLAGRLAKWPGALQLIVDTEGLAGKIREARTEGRNLNRLCRNLKLLAKNKEA